MTALHQQENELNSLRLRMAQVEVKLDRKLALEESVEEHTAEVVTCEGRIEVGVTITGFPPLILYQTLQHEKTEVEVAANELRSAYQTTTHESGILLQEAETFAQGLNRDVDGLRMRQNMINR